MGSTQWEVNAFLEGVEAWGNLLRHRRTSVNAAGMSAGAWKAKAEGIPVSEAGAACASFFGLREEGKQMP